MRNIDPQEWEVRSDLAAAYRLIAHYGMDDLIFIHLSARLPGKEHRFLLNPFGMLFDEITASSLVTVVRADGWCRGRRRAPRAGRAKRERQAPRCGGLPADLSSRTYASGIARALGFALRATGTTEDA